MGVELHASAVLVMQGESPSCGGWHIRAESVLPQRVV